MSSQAAHPKLEICAHTQRLGEAFIRAVREVMQLQDLEIAAVRNDGEGLARFDLALRVARTRRDAAKQAYLLHIQQHGCVAV